MNRSFVVVLGGILFSAIGVVRAAQWCSGTLVSVYMYSDGTVTIQGSWRNDYTTLCNNQGTFGGIDGVTCLAWFGAAVKAQTGQSRVTVYYPNDGGFTCANLPTYGNSPVPGYLMVTQ